MTTIEKILTIAYEMFAKSGYEKTSMSSIASRVGISKPALYHYFKTKDALFETLFQVIIDEIKSESTFEGHSIEALKRYLIEIGQESIEYELSHPEFGGVIKQYRLLALRNDVFMKLMSDLEDKLKSRFKGILIAAGKKGLIEDQDIETLTAMLYLMDSSLSAEIIMGNDMDYKKIWTMFIERIL